MNTLHAWRHKLLAALALTAITGAATAADAVAPMAPRRTTLRDEVRAGVLTKAQARRIRADRRQVRAEHLAMVNATHAPVVAPPVAR